MLTCIVTLTAAAFSSTGRRIFDELAPGRPSGDELLDFSVGDESLNALKRASRALQRKSAVLNQLLAKEREQSNFGEGNQKDNGQSVQPELHSLIHEGASLKQLRRALESKTRLLAKFRREFSRSDNSDSRYSELTQVPKPPSSVNVPAELPGASQPASSSAPAAVESAEGPLQKKINLLNNILDDAAFNLGPEESDTYHAPETADLDDQIADIKVFITVHLKGLLYMCAYFCSLNA